MQAWDLNLLRPLCRFRQPPSLFLHSKGFDVQGPPSVLKSAWHSIKAWLVAGATGCLRLCRPVPVLDSRQVSKQREPIEGGWLKSSPKSEAETSCSPLAEEAGRAERLLLKSTGQLANATRRHMYRCCSIQLKKKEKQKLNWSAGANLICHFLLLR